MECLKQLGVSVDVSNVEGFRNESIREYDIVHVFNITGACQTTLSQILTAKKYNKPVVLSSIYWYEAELRQVERAMAARFIVKKPEISYLKSFFISLLRAVNLEQTIDAITYIRDKFSGNTDDSFRALIAFGRKKVQESCLALADVILPNSQSEADLLVRMFGVNKKKLIVVPNGVDSSFLTSNSELFKNKYSIDNFILSVANIATRKNTLSLITALSGIKIPLVLIGAFNPRDAYYKLCKKAADGRSNIFFLGRVPHGSPMLASAYAGAKVHAQVSWFETPGLSSLEAALSDCNLVVSCRGSTRDYFENFAWYCDPGDTLSVRRAVLAAYDSPVNNSLRSHILNHFTWEKAAEKTYEAYISLKH